MSANFKPQPPSWPPPFPGVRAPLRPVPNFPTGPYLETALKQYYSGAVRFAAATTMTDVLNYVGPPPGSTGISSAASFDGWLYGPRTFQCGVISFWMRWAPSEQTAQAWPLIGQTGPFDMSAYFGSDPATFSMGTIEVQLVPLPETAVEFAPGAT